MEFKNECVPGDVISVGAVLDVRVGGSFRIVMKSKEREHVHIGTYQVVELTSKLVFTWAAPETPKKMTLVTVEFLADGDESELVLTHERFPKRRNGRALRKRLGNNREKICWVSFSSSQDEELITKREL
jgi:uncharacterized protein YndB with AHSA1/START domain